MSQQMLAGNGALWVQPDGPNTQPKYLGCHMLADVTIPKGDVTLTYCPDPSGPNKYKVKRSYQGEPGAVTFSIETDIEGVADYLEGVSCPVNLFVNMVDCGRKDVFTNYVRSFLLQNATVTSEGLASLVARQPSDETPSTQTFEFSAEILSRIYGLTAARVAIAETTGLNDIHFCNPQKCADDCGAAEDICTDGVAVSDAPAGSPSWDADIWSTSNEGAAWTATAADPFSAGENIISVVCFQYGRSTTRWLIARDADAANPMEVGYSDDGGVTWTMVEVGTVNNLGAVGPGALFALDGNHIWLALSGGYVYFSSDGGATWTEQTAGNVTANDLSGVHFANESDGMAVGASDTVIRTADGGTTWEAATATGGGNTLNTVAENDNYGIWWTGDNGGNLYYSGDRGTTWTSRAFDGSGAGEVQDIKFFTDLVGWMVHDSAAPVGTLFRTRDGGYHWEEITTVPTNSGLNALFVCNENLAWAVGEAHSGTAMVVKATK